MSKATWDWDDLILVVVVLGAVVWGIAQWASIWAAIVGWMVEHQVLVTEDLVWTWQDQPPAGLDGVRVVIAVGLAVILLLIASQAGRAAVRRRTERKDAALRRG